MESAGVAKALLSQSFAQGYGGTNSSFEDAKGNSAEAEGGIFPLEPFKLLPTNVVAVLPLPWKRIVSLPHLVLLIASFTSVAVLIETIVAWHTFGCRADYCEGRITPIVFVACCMGFFFRTLQQYDARLVHKQKELQVAKMELDERYKETIQDLEGYLAKALETEVTFAERAFDSHRRDFNRFLHRYQEKLHGSGATEETADSLKAFCSFARRWLGFFSEASIDPVNHPLLVVASDDMERCTTRAEVAALVSERLASVEVEFVSKQREKDKEELLQVRSSWVTKSKVQKNALAFKEALCGRVPVFHALSFQKQEADVEVAEPSTLSFEGEPAQMSNAVDEYSWVRWGRSQSLGVKHEDGESLTTLPAQLHLGCVTIVLLSCEHLLLIIAFFLGIAVLILEGPILQGLKYSLIAETLLCLICIAFILHEFLDIDIVQQLDAQLRALEAEQLKVLQKRERIMGFYKSTQELGDLWLHHTIPHLDLMKCFCDGFLDLPVKDHVFVMNGIEEQLGALQQSTPPLEHFRGDSMISDKQKKALNNIISDLVRKNRGIVDTLAMMPQCHIDAKVALGLEVATTKAAEPECAAIVDGSSPIEAGSAVEYFSKSRWRWIPARVLRIDPVTGLLDLDYKNQVDPSNVRPIGPEAQQDSGCGQQ